MPLDPDALQTQLTGNLNAQAQVLAWCSAIANTTVAPSPGAWYQPFMANLAVAQGHTAAYLNVIGPDAWSTLPNAIVNYSSTHNNAMGDVQDILDSVGSGDLSDEQIATIVQIFQALEQYLQQLLGTPTDSNLAAPPSAQPTLYGTQNDLATFRTNVTSDNNALTQGQQGAAQEVALLQVDETKMNSDISTLQGEIAIWNQEIVESEIGIGVSIFVAVVGIALAPATGGSSLVATGIGVAGLGGSIASTVVYSEKVKAAFDEIAADQAELTTDQQQVNALNGIINTFANLGTVNTNAQAALQGIVTAFAGLIDDAQNTIAALQNADSGAAKGILETLNIQNAMSDWTNLSNLAQGILNSTVNQQQLTPPQPSAAQSVC